MTIGLSPTIHLGPFNIAWHGLLTAVGLVISLVVARWTARRMGLDPAPLFTALCAAALAGVIGARLYYLAQADPERLLRPWSGGSQGFAFYGAVILGLPAAALSLRLGHRPVLPYLDALALSFPAAMAIGRVGDVINGEHYGPPTSLPWGIVYRNPSAEVPHTGVAYQSGALYEVVLVVLLFACALAVRARLPRAGDMLWLILAGYSLLRFVVFFWVRDVPVVGLGLRQAQWTSLALLLFAGAGALATRRIPRLAGSQT